MAFKRIPRKFDCPEIASDLKNRLLYSDDIDSGSIQIIADIMGTSKRTVYATLDGDIKLSLDFLHAAVIATNGDPEIAKYLEPEGFRLNKTPQNNAPDKPTLDKECLDDLPSVTRYHAMLLAIPRARRIDVELARNAAIYELEQDFNKWLEDEK